MAEPRKKRGLAALLQVPAALASPVAAEVGAGLSGLYGLMTGGMDEAARRVDRTREKLTYRPTDPRAQRVLSGLSSLMQPLAQADSLMRRPVQDIASPLAASGRPGMATAVSMAPDVIGSLAGLRPAGMAANAAAAQMVERSAAPMMGSPVSQIGAIRAYHGSPHDFDRFSMANIGTGEGAQAYGHGLYFAGEKAVAEQYAQAVKDMGAVQNANARMSELAREMAKYERPGSYRQYNDPRGYEAAQEYDALMSGRHETLQKPGNVYDVELAPDEADLLDWDAPLSEQPEKVRAALAKTRSYQNVLEDLRAAEVAAQKDIDAGNWGADSIMERDSLRIQFRKKYGEDSSGADFYRRGLGQDSPEAASALLRQLGIPGIRYLDGGSRAAGDGSRNYVMFDDSLVKIRGKE